MMFMEPTGVFNIISVEVMFARLIEVLENDFCNDLYNSIILLVNFHSHDRIGRIFQTVYQGV